MCAIKHTLLGGIYTPISFDCSLVLASLALATRLGVKGLIED